MSAIKPGERPADPARDAPCHREANDADHGAGKPARLEQIERQDLGEQCGDHVEAAAVEVEIDELERAPVLEAGRVERQQQVAVLRVGVVVPAEAVVAEGERRDNGDEREHAEGDTVVHEMRRLIQKAGPRGPACRSSFLPQLTSTPP